MGGFLVVIGVFATLAATLAGFAAWHALQRRTQQSVRHAVRARLGMGSSVAVLAQRLQVPAAQLLQSGPSYRVAAIPKRSGGQRTLHIPDAATRDVQRRILRRVLGPLRTHPAAHAYERGRSIATHARLHTGKALLVCVDVEEFFARTQTMRLEHYFRRVGWNAEAAALLARWCTVDGGLPQGAPTSPRLSNLVNFGLDTALERLAHRCGATYSRYADDIVFSMTWTRTQHESRLVQSLVDLIRRRLKAYGYRLNRKKLRVLRSHQQQRMTGVVVNHHVALPRATRRWLRAVEHHARTGQPTTLNAEQRAGWRAYASMIALQGNAGAPPADARAANAQAAPRRARPR